MSVKIKRLNSKGCNVYLLEKSGKCLLIDTGTPNSGKLVESQLKSRDIKLEGIMITHAHFDHIGSAAYLQKKFGCEIFVHRDDMPYLLGEKKFRYSGILGKVVAIGERLFRIKYPEEAKPIDEAFGIFEDLNLSVEIIHTPGHTPGSVCIKLEERLFCGDLLRGGKKPSLSPKAFCSDYSSYLSSVRSIVSIDFSLAFPGHGERISKKEIKNLLKKTQ